MGMPKRIGSTTVDLLLIVGALASSVYLYKVGSTRIADLDQVGEGPQNACALSRTADRAQICSGLPLTSFGDNNDTKRWLNTLGWTAGTTQARAAVTRDRGRRDTTKTLTIKAITDVRRLPLNRLLSDSLVVARISGATDDGLVERKYGIGGARTDGMDSVFYLVLSPYRAPGLPRKVVTRNQITIMRWTLWGTRSSDGSLQRVRTGKLKWCRHTHPSAATSPETQFINCDEQRKQDELQMAVIGNQQLQTADYAPIRLALDSMSVLSLARRERERPIATKLGLANVLNDEQRALVERALTRSAFTSSGWISCGIGCCSIEPD